MKLQVLFLETGQEERLHSGAFGEYGLLCLGCDSVFKILFSELYTWHPQCQQVGSAALCLRRFLLHLLLADI